MEKTVRVRLSETASNELLQLMEWWGHQNPTHSANKAIHQLYVNTLKSRSQYEEPKNEHKAIH